MTGSDPSSPAASAPTATAPARKSVLRALLIKSARLAGIAYATLFLFALVFGEGKIFQPQPASYADSNELLKLTTPDGEKIAALLLAPAGAKYAVIYSHGNAEDLGDVRPNLQHLADLGFAVLGYDYHGYGRSTGKPSEKAACADIDAAYAYLTETRKIPPGRIIIYGRSVGGGPSVDMAARKPVAGLILENAFTSAFRVVTRVPLLPFDYFRNIDKIGKVRCPVLVIHGRSDEVVPFHHGQALFDAANEPKQCLWIDGGRHNSVTLQSQAAVDGALRNFVQSMEAGR